MTTVIRAYYEDSYQKEVRAVVTAVAGEWVELDCTVFYPLGGGQPGDTGVLKNFVGDTFKVLDAQKSDSAGQIKHQLETAEHGLKEGDAVDVEIDWQRRYRHMRMHTCMHLLCAVVDAGVTGGAIAADKGRLDFDLPEPTLDKERITAELNRLIGEDHPVETHLIPNILKAALGSGKTLRIFGTDYPTPDGTAVRDYVHVEDLARAHLLALECLAGGGESRSYNLGTGDGNSVRQVLETARAVTGKKIPAFIPA